MNKDDKGQKLSEYRLNYAAWPPIPTAPAAVS